MTRSRQLTTITMIQRKSYTRILSVFLCGFTLMHPGYSDTVDWRTPPGKSFTIGQDNAYVEVRSMRPDDDHSSTKCDCDPSGNPVNYEYDSSTVTFTSNADPDGKIDTSQVGPVTVTVSEKHLWKCPTDETKTTTTNAQLEEPNASLTVNVGSYRVDGPNRVQVGETASFTLRDAEDLTVEVDSWSEPLSAAGTASWSEIGTKTITASKDGSTYTSSVDVLPAGALAVTIDQPSDNVIVAKGTALTFKGS